MKRKWNLYAAVTLSVFSTMMLAAFLIIWKTNQQTWMFEAPVYLGICAAAVLLSAGVTWLSVSKSALFDEYQIQQVWKQKEITRFVAVVLIGGECILGLCLKNLTLIVCLGLPSLWIILFVEAILVLRIGIEK